MKRNLLFILVALLPIVASAEDAQELTVSDIEFINNGYYDEHPMIILTKEGSALNVHLMNYPAHPYTEEFVITPKMSGGSDGEPCSVSIGVSYINNSLATIITTFNVSFNVHGIEANSFYFSCWWYKGMVSLTEGEPLELWENKKISKDGVIYVLNNKTKTATLSSGRHVEGEYNIPSELDYGGQTFLLTSIDYPAFSDNTSLTSVIIPQSVANIGNAVFYRCSNLSDVYCYAENVPETGINVFNETPIASATLHVPAGSIDLYKTTSPWSEFGNTVEIPLVTFTEGQMATIILPTEPDASKGKYYSLDKCKEGQIIFEQELQPQARVPYIIIPNEDFSIDPSTMDLEGLSHDAVSIEGISFIGSYSHEEFSYQEGFYIDIIDTTPDCLDDWFGSGKAIVGPLRAYLQVNWDDPYTQGGTKDPQKVLEIVLKDHGTGINEVQDSKSKIQNESVIFDLSGRRISTSQPFNFSTFPKGVYIFNGKKRMVK